MAGFNNAESAAVMELGVTNARYPYVMWSENGTSETANVGRMAATWNAATVADPSVKGISGPLLSPAASGACTISHWAAISAATAGTQRIDWTALDTAIPLITGGQISVADNSLEITLT